LFRPSQLRRTFPAALRDVESDSASTRASAVADLVEHAEVERSRVVATLERCLSDRAAEVRAAAAVALADVRGVEALAALLVAIEDDDAHVRQMAITAIGEIGDARAHERLRRALTDERPEVRFQAVIAFLRVAGDEGVDQVVAAFDDADPSIRYIALRCAEEHAVGGERPAPRVIVEGAARLVDDSDVAVRVAAAILLARSGDRRGETVLLDVVRGALATREAEDEAAAVELCGELGVAAAEPHLVRRAFGYFGFGEDRFAWQALVSLARMGHTRARSKIVRDLGSWWRDRRTLAVAAVGRARLAEARALVEAMRGDESRADADAVAETLAQLGAVSLSEANLEQSTP
jgi:HEAT repeat protein